MAYTRVNWQNSPSHATPLSAENLNVMDAAIEELDGAVTDAEGTIATLESTVSDQATTISGLQTTVGEHTTDIQNAQDDISDLQTTVSGHTTSISGLQTTVSGHTTSIGNLANLTTTEKSNLVGAVNEVDSDVSDLKEDLTTETNTRESAVADLNAKVSTLSDAVTLSTTNNDKVPYLFRQSGGGKYIGGIEKDTIVGGTVAWNQLFDPVESVTVQSVSISSQNGKITISGTASGNGGRTINILKNSINITNGHVYALVETVGLDSSLVPHATSLADSSLYMNFAYQGKNIQKAVFSAECKFGFNVASGTVYNKSGYINIIDLTQLFGSTIADYIYSLEQATAGAGIAKLKSWGFFTEDYYPYDAGSLKSVEGLSAHVMRDADENIIGNYPLDSDLILRGIPKLDSENQLYYDGDRYLPDGTVERRYGIVDLGTLNGWSRNPTFGAVNTYYVDVPSIKAVTPAKTANLACNKYVVCSANNMYLGKDFSICQNTTGVRISDPNDLTVDQFKTAISGVYLVYELATPTTETADPYQTPQLVDKDGTEEYVTTGIVPVGHDTDYYLDADSVLTPPNTAGTYSLKVTVASDGSKSYSWVSD